MGAHDVKGSAKQVKILDDLGSALVQEIVEQLNSSEIAISQSLVAGIGDTARAVLGRWRYDTWVRELSILNATSAAIDQAGSAIRIGYCASTDGAMDAGGPAAPTYLLALVAFNGTPFAAGRALWADDFIAGTNVVAKTGSGTKFKVPAGSILFAEFVNGEGALTAISVSAIVAPTDQITMEPTAGVHFKQRDFARSARSL